jgi:hypothetical protein
MTCLIAPYTDQLFYAAIYYNLEEYGEVAAYAAVAFIKVQRIFEAAVWPVVVAIGNAFVKTRQAEEMRRLNEQREAWDESN